MGLGLTDSRHCCEFRIRGLAVVIPELAGSLFAGLSLHKQIPSHPAAPLDQQTQALACTESCRPLGGGEQ